MQFAFNPFTDSLDAVGGGGARFTSGSIIWWPDTLAPPSGWLKCDGSLVSKEDYPALFEVIGYTFGQDNGRSIPLIAEHSDYTSSTGTVRASSEYSSSYRAWYPLTTSQPTYCSATTSSGEWWEYEFTEPKLVAKFTINVKANSFTIRLEGSNDGSTYTTLMEGVSINNGTHTVDIPEAAQAEFLIYRLTMTSSGNWFWFDDFQFYDYIPPDPNLFGLPNINTGISNIIAIIRV